MASGRDLAPHHGQVLPCLPNGFLDGPTGAKKKRPRSVEEWPHVSRGVLVPDIFLPCSDPSSAGALIDAANDIPFTANNGASGAVGYQVSLANWTGLWASFGASPVANRGFRAAFERAWDPGMPIFFSFLMQLSAVGGSRTLFTLCGSSIIQVLAGGNLSLIAQGATTVTGTANHIHATNVYAVCGLFDPIGSTILRVSTSLETVSISGWTPQGDTAIGKGFGGSASPPNACLFSTAAFWLGDRAIYMGDRSAAGVVTTGSRGGAALLVSELAA